MLENEIRRLASRPESTHPFLTFYVDTNRNDETQKDRLRLFLKNEAQRLRDTLHGNGHGSIERGLRQIEDYIANSLDAGTRGVAIFSCPEEEFFVPLQLPVPVRQQLDIGGRPHIRQLAELRQAYPRVVVVLVDGKSARLFKLQFGTILEEIDLENPDMPRKHEQGGWSQANLQRHVQDHIDRHHKEVADVLTKFADEARLHGVVLSGQERNIANFRGFLPKRLDEKILGTLHLDIRSSADEVASAAQRVINDRRAADLAGRLATLEDFTKKNGRGALGLARVIDAINQRKIETLFVSARAAGNGWRCTSCKTVGQTIPLGCPACGSAVVSIDLVDEAIAAAHRDDAPVDFIQQESVLDTYDGVGATLRF